MNQSVICPCCGVALTLAHQEPVLSDRRVRCGHCMTVFDINAEPAPTSFVLAPKTDDPLAKQSWLLSEHAIQQNALSSELPQLGFILQVKKRRWESGPFMRIALIAMASLLAAVLALQVLRHERVYFSEALPEITPAIHRACLVWSCSPSAARQIKQWVIDGSNFERTSDNRFHLSVTIKNLSIYPLLIPQVELQLLDRRDALLVRYVISTHSGRSISLSGAADRTYDWLLAIHSRPEKSFNAQAIAGYRLVLFYP